jgi:hypothetical protein
LNYWTRVACARGGNLTVSGNVSEVRKLKSILQLATLVAAAMSLCVARPVLAEAAWKVLGEKQVKWTSEFDTINIGKDAGKFVKLRLNVRGGPLFVRDMDVVYTNGMHDDIPLGLEIKKNSQSRIIDLRGDSRSILRVKFIYRRPANAEGTTIELWGQSEGQ